MCYLLQDEVRRFLKDCRLVINGILEKIFERSLSGSSFLDAACCISPNSVLSKPKAHLFRQIKFLLHRILSCFHITSSECDLAFTLFSKLLDESSSTLLAVFKKIHAGVRLDDLCFKTVKVGVNYRVLSQVLNFIFALGHGQASIEKGFSINSNMLRENLKEISLVSRRIIKNFMVSNKLKAY